MFDQNGLKSFCNERNLQVAPGGIGCLQYGHSLSAWFKTSSGSDFIGSSLTLHYWLLLLQLRAEMFYVLATVTCLRRHAVSLSLTLSLVSFSPLLLLLLLSVSLSHHLTFTLSHFCWNFFLPFSSLDFFFWKLTFVWFLFSVSQSWHFKGSTKESSWSKVIKDSYFWQRHVLYTVCWSEELRHFTLRQQRCSASSELRSKNIDMLLTQVDQYDQLIQNQLFITVWSSSFTHLTVAVEYIKPLNLISDGLDFCTLIGQSVYEME